MRVAVTGTPGTGKTTATERLETDLSVIHLNEAIRKRGFTLGRDEKRDAVIADLDAVREWLADRPDVLVESHLAHHVPVDRVVVLRCDPAVLEERLAERGGDPPANRTGSGTEEESGTEEGTKTTRVAGVDRPEDDRLATHGDARRSSARENAESEALDIVLTEAVREHGTENVYEVVTTDRSPAAVAGEIEAVISGDRAPSAGTVSYVDYLDPEFE